MNRIRNYFFRLASARSFGGARLSFYGALFIFYTRWNSVSPSGWETMDGSAFWQPRSFFALLPSSFWLSFNPGWMYYLWIVSMVAAGLGLLFRYSSWIAFLSFLYLTGLPINFGKIHHSNHMPVVILGIFACTGLAGAFSFDELWARSRGRAFIQASRAYGWFFATVLFYMCLTYMNAGLNKWWIGGAEWGDNESMATIILTRPTVTEWGRWVASSNWIPGLLAWATLLIQPLAPLALFSRWAYWILIPSLFMIHVGTYALLGAHGAFVPYNLCFLVLLPWEYWFPAEGISRGFKSLWSSTSNA